MVVLQSVEGFAGLSVPNLAIDKLESYIQIEGGVAYAEKSADPVAARAASAESLPCQTAPLCPMKVPILQNVS
jgi:hypothetical protein